MMKKIGVTVMALVLLIAAGLVYAGDVNCGDLLQKAEELWMNNDFDGSNKVVADAAKACPKNPEVLWRKARNLYDKLENIPRDKKPDKDTLIVRYREVETLGQQCISLAGKDGNCWLWKGIGMGRRGTTQGILNSLTEAAELERVFLKVVELKPAYRSADGAANALGDAYNALGQFYRVVPEWLCTIGIKQVVGTCGDLDKSVDYQRKAVAREPKRIEYNKELGVSLICHGQKREKPEEVAEGKKVLAGVAALPEVKPSDKIDKEHAKMLIADPSLACGYSRDAQQEQSREAYKD